MILSIMKSKCLSILSLLAATSAFAADFVYQSPDSLGIVTIKPEDYPYAEATFRLDENGTVATSGSGIGRGRFMTSGAVRSVVTDSQFKTSSFNGWDFLGDWNVNLCTGGKAEGEYIAVDLDADTRLLKYGNNGTFRVYNFDGNAYGDKTTALVNFQKLSITNGSTLQMDTNARMEGKELAITSNGGGLVVSRGVLEYKVENTTWDTKTTAYLQVNEGTTFKMMTPSAMQLNVGTIAGTFANETTNQLQFIGKTGSLVVSETGTLFSKGRLVAKGSFEVSGDAFYLSNAGPLLLEATGNLTLNKRNALQAAHLSTKEAYDADANRDKTFIVRNEDGVDVYYKIGSASVVAYGNSNVININERNAFELTMSGAERLTINVASDATLILTNLKLYNKDSYNLILGNFEEDAIFLLESAVTAYNDKLFNISATDAEGNEYTKDDMALVAGTFEGLNGYWLAVAVPEPAEWAMIFGGIALGLAIYRRRK